MTARGGRALVCAAAAALLVVATAAGAAKPLDQKPPKPGGERGDRKPPKPPDDVNVASAGEIVVTIAWDSGDGEHGDRGTAAFRIRRDGGPEHGDHGRGDHGIAAFGVYRDGVLVASTTAGSYTFSPLPCGRDFVFGVDAVDKAGNRSRVVTVPGSTTACRPPSVPSGLAVAATADGLTLSWNPSQDDTGVAGYGAYLDGSKVGDPTGTTFTFTGLHCGETHTLGADAVDVAGNRSATATVSASTAACPADRFVAATGSDFRWVFLAATYDGVTLSLYVDGRLASSTPVAGAIAPSAGPLRLGGDDPWGEWFAGVLDNVRVYNRPLGPAALSADMSAPVTAAAPGPDPAGLVAAYSLDAGSGTTVADLSGHGNDGTIDGAAWTAAGRFGGGLAFDGTDDRVTIPGSASLGLTTGMTLEAWVDPSALDPIWRVAVIKELPGSPSPDFALYAHASDLHGPSAHVSTDREYMTTPGTLLPRNACTDRLNPCATFGHAYAEAAPGQVVTAADGVYGDQRIEADPAKAAGPVVLFRPAPGANVSVGKVTVAGASQLELRDMTLAGWETLAGTSDVTFRDVTSGYLLVDSSSNISVIGGTYGPQTNYDDGQIRPACAGCAHSTNILVDGAYFHDAVLAPGSDAHVECLQVWGTDHLVIRNSKFFNCEVHDVFVSGEGEPVSDVTFENNWAGGVRTGYYSLRVAANGAGEGCKNILYRYNSTTVPISVECTTVDNVRIVGNLGPLSPMLCDARYTYSHNVWDGAACGATDLNAPSGYVDPAAFDLDLLPSSAAIDNGDPADFPPTDIYGHRRPRGPAPDAGAVEAR